MTLIDREIPHQGEYDVVEVSRWTPDEEFPIFPIGARSKELKYCPADCPEYLLPGHRYLFKHSWHRYPDQFWAEIIAYRVGRMLGLSVPPSFVAFDSSANIAGSLTEWFIGYEGLPYQQYVAGGDFMQALDEGFDRDKGTRHSFDNIRTLSIAFARSPRVKLTSDWQKYWSECLLFDALTGNTDRHQDNWGVLLEPVSPARKPRVAFTPYFDNGTSLGHEIQAERQKRMLDDPAHMERYIRRGHHHMRPHIGAPKMQHMNFLNECGLHQPEIIESLVDLLNFSDDDLSGALDSLANVRVSVPLTEERIYFVKSLIKFRQKLILESLSGVRE